MMGIPNLQNSAALTFTCAVTAILIGAVFAAKWQQHSKKKSKPTKWKRVGELSEIFIYPLKSGQGIKLDAAECTDMGLKTTDDHPLKIRDRFFIAFSEDTGNMKTARQHPQMVLIKISSADGNHVTFEAPDMPILKFRLPEKQDDSGKKICKLWFSETAEALDCGDEAAEWMSMYITKKKSGLRLGYHLTDVLGRRDFSKPPRNVFKDFYEKLEANDSGLYSDFSSYMLMTEESVKDVHSRVASTVSKLTPLQFRPNFVVRGSKAFDEDKWDWLRIGDNVILRNFKPCTRCILTTVDPETGIKHKGMEPLKTLKSYRNLVDAYTKKKGEESPALGINLGLRSAPGIVRVGDPIYVSI